MAMNNFLAKLWAKEMIGRPVKPFFPLRENVYRWYFAVVSGCPVVPWHCAADVVDFGVVML